MRMSSETSNPYDVPAAVEIPRGGRPTGIASEAARLAVWQLVMGVLLLVAFAFFSLYCVLLMAVVVFAPRGADALSIVITALLFGINAFVLFLPGWMLLRASSQLRRLHSDSLLDEFADAVKQQARLWLFLKILAVLATLGLGFGLLSSLV